MTNESMPRESGDRQSGPRDYSHEVDLSGHPVKRWALLITGVASLILGVIGVFLPVMPTVPFLLLSAWCFARSSPRFYNWIMNHRVFGPPLRDFRIHRAIRLRVKIFSTVLIVLTMGTSIVLFVPFPPAKIIMAAIGLGVILYIWRFPTRPE